jgi:thioredoxin 1
MELVLNNGNFQKEVLESELPVLVDFYADWCGPCKMMGPIITALASEFDGRCKVGKCNIDEEMELAGSYRVMSIPTMIIFKDGKPVETIIGAMTKTDLADKLAKMLR